MASVYKRGGKKNRRGKWLATWRDHTGKKRTASTGTTDYAAACRIAAQWEKDALLRRAGLIDVQAERYAEQASRPLRELLTEYTATLIANSRSGRYIKEAGGYVERFIEAAGVETAADLTADKLTTFAAGLAAAGRSARTVQAAIGGVKSFTKWLADCGKIPHDPMVRITKPNPEANRRRVRRMLLPEEWPFLLSATVNGPDRHGMTGPERALLYQVAVATGLRSGELRSLTRSSIVLNQGRPYIQLKAAGAKNRKTAQQFIDADLAKSLRKHIDSLSASAPLFAMPDRTKPAKMLRADLAAARATWLADAADNPAEIEKREKSFFLLAQNEEGEWLDFHSLRHTCGGWLTSQGVNPKVVQSIMRHSSPVLTMNRYGHMLPGAEADAASQLGAMVSLAHADAEMEAGEAEAVQPDDTDAQRQAQRSDREPMQRQAVLRDQKSRQQGERDTAKMTKPVTVQRVTHRNATQCNEMQKRRAWDSNPQPVARHLNSNQAASHSLTLQE